jgi:glycosyltransferase involved in cell wall biosynthesis
MRVLYLIETLGVGGAENSLLELLPRMKQVQPLVCHVYEGSELKDAYEAAGLPVVSLDIPPKYHFRRAVHEVRALVREFQPHLIHTTLFRAEVVGRYVGRQSRVPVVCSFVSECYADVRWRSLTPTGRFKLKGIQLLDRLTAPWAAHFIANSQTVRDSETRSLRVPPERVSVIYRGRDPERFALRLPREVAAKSRADLGLADGARVVINVGRLVDSKGHAELIEAFAHVIKTEPDAVLLLAGDGPEQSQIEAHIRRLGLGASVQLLGSRSDIPELLAMSDVFAFPSHYEGHPGAVVEAMFAGVPMVLSDIPVHRETVEQGASALLVPLHEPAPLAAAIVSLLRDPARAAAIGTLAQQVALRHFTVERAARAYEALYSDLLMRPRHNAGEHRSDFAARPGRERKQTLASHDH